MQFSIRVSGRKCVVVGTCVEDGNGKMDGRVERRGRNEDREGGPVVQTRVVTGGGTHGALSG